MQKVAGLVGQTHHCKMISSDSSWHSRTLSLMGFDADTAHQRTRYWGVGGWAQTWYFPYCLCCLVGQRARLVKCPCYWGTEVESRSRRFNRSADTTGVSSRDLLSASVWCVFDGSDACCSDKLDIHEDPERFVVALAEYALMTGRRIGLEYFY